MAKRIVLAGGSGFLGESLADKWGFRLLVMLIANLIPVNFFGFNNKDDKNKYEYLSLSFRLCNEKNLKNRLLNCPAVQCK